MNVDRKAFCSNLNAYYGDIEDDLDEKIVNIVIGAILVGLILIQLKRYHEHYSFITPCNINGCNNVNNDIDNNCNENYYYDDHRVNHRFRLQGMSHCR